MHCYLIYLVTICNNVSVITDIKMVNKSVVYGNYLSNINIFNQSFMTLRTLAYITHYHGRAEIKKKVVTIFLSIKKKKSNIFFALGLQDDDRNHNCQLFPWNCNCDY